MDYRYGRSPAPTVAEAVASLPDYVVSDAGTDVVNGTYTEDGTNSYGAPRWVHTGGTYFLHSHPDNSHWVISTDGSNAYVGVYYYNDPTPYDQTIPPSSSWVSSAGNDPAPTVAEYVPVLANYIVSGAGWADVNGTYVENGTYNGHPSYFFTGTTYYILFNNGWEGDRWEIVENFEIKEYSTIYFTDATGDTPPSTGWNDNGNPPAPSVAEAVPTLSYSSETFTESINNDGTISNSLVITYTIPGSDYFTGSTGTFSAANYTATNVPAGLTMVITKNSNTELSVSFTGTATNSGSANNISNLEITFNDAAFNAGDASAVTNSTKSDLNVSYYDNVQNCSLSFDGNDDYVSCAASADLPVGNASRTIEAYIKGSSWPTQSNILSWGSSSDNSNRCSIGIYMDHFAFFGGDNILDGSISINDDFWHHVAVVFNGTNMYLYVDGVLDISGAKTLNTSGQDLRIGINASPSDDEYWYGEIDEIRIWNVARSEAEIQANLHNELTGTETGLLAYFKMSNGTGTSLTDNSTSAHTGTISGAVWVNYPHIQPTVTTTAASEITGSTATSGGNLTSTDWTFSCGVCWNTTGTPEISDDHTTDGAGIGSFTSSLTGLHCATTYYVRAYATNNSAKGIVYGNQISFAIDATANGDWQTQQLTLYNTTEAAIMVRSGDIDNLGYGWPVDFDPFSGESTPTHAINFSPEGDDVAGTDQKLKPTSCATVSMPCNNDGYWPTAVYPTAISMSYDLQETTVVAATIQMFVDDFQAETWCATYTASINGVDAPFIANVINSLDQTGPIGKIITLVLPTAHVLLVDAGVISIMIDDLTTGAGDGFAIDFAKLLINPTGYSYTGTINGYIRDQSTDPIENALVTASSVSGTTNSSGYYSLSNVPAGQVYVEATKNGYFANSTLVDLVSEGNVEANLTLSDATIIWDGSESADWNTSANWNTNAVPSIAENASVPLVALFPVIDNAPGSPAICNHLNIASDAAVSINAGKALTVNGNLINAGILTVNSSLAGTGSLIVGGTSTGNVVFKRYVDEITKSTKWHYISAPVAGQAIDGAWMTANTIAQYESAYQFYRWDEDTESWIIYGSEGNPEAFGDATFIDARGYCVTKSGAGVYSFTGTIRTDDLNYLTTYTSGMGTGYNLVGNPFSSAIGITGSASTAGNFLDANAALLNDNYEAIYIWDEQTGYTGDRNDYKVISNGAIGEYSQIAQDYIQPGQAFMVTVVSGGGNLAFNENMQAHAGVDYHKETKEPWPVAELIVENNDLFNTTAIGFNKNMTTGLDPSYDVGKMKGNPNIAVYTRLVDDNGVDFAIQALPFQNIENFIIPIGVDVAETAILKFSVHQKLLDDMSIILEDRQENIFTNLRWDTYFAEICQGGTGRFYLHFKDATAIGEISPQTNISLRFIDGVILINNPDQETGLISMVNVSGQILNKIELNGSSAQEMRIQQPAGIYVFSVHTGETVLSRKLFVK